MATSTGNDEEIVAFLPTGSETSRESLLPAVELLRQEEKSHNQAMSRLRKFAAMLLLLLAIAVCVSKLNLSRELTKIIPRSSIKESSATAMPPDALIVPNLIVPNVLLVGAQKAGTTAVASWLFQEHNVCHAKPIPDEPQYYSKEVHFFNQRKRYKRGAEFYASHFNHCTSAKLTMDATPGYEINPFRVRDFYMNNHSSASALASTSVSFDDLKLMMILREPISRELSWYNHQKALYIQNNQTSNGKQYWSHIGNPATNGSAYTFDEYVDQYLLPRQAKISASKSYVCGHAETNCVSFFSKHLRQWFDWIPRHQMLILSYAELKNDPATFMTRVEDFLGIVPTPKEDSMKEANAKESPAKTDLPSCSSQKKLQAIFEPWNEDLYSLLEQNPGPSMEQRPFSRFQLGECEEVSSPIPSTSAPQALIVPNVLLVGAQKAGTTAVASWLFKEHNVCHAKPMPDEPQYYSKEVHFFDQHKRYQRGAEFYASHFNHCTSAKLTMDATPGYEINPFRVRDFYMNNHSSASALASTSVSFDDLKLMMILREPISRELSWYNHQKALYIQNNQTSNGKQYWSHIGNPATNGSAYTFDEYVDQYLLPRQARISASKSYVCEEEENRCKSFFSKHLRQWFDWIPRHQMLILSYAELKNDPATFMTRVEDFLGIVRTPKEDSMKEANAKESPAKTDLPSCSSQKKLQAIFEPWNEDLYSLLEQNPGPSMEQRPFSRFQLGECEEVSSPIPSTSAPQALIVPNVLLVGAQKAGTTAVASWLFKEHNVCHAKPMPDEPQYYSKEVHFFDQHKRYQRGAEFYASHFNHCTSAKLTMDATPGYEINPFRVRDFYMNNHSSASALASTSVSFDDLKLMMILREPISRELSWYNHQKALYIQNNQTSNGKQYWSHIGNPATNGSAYTFDEYVDQYLLPRQARISASKSYVCEEEENRCKSFFSKHLRQWFDWIPRHQMLILSYAELKNDPATFMTRVEDFLGIVRTPKEDSMKEANAKESPAKTDLPSCSSQKKLQAIFEPWNEDLYSLLEQNPGPSMEQRPFSRFQLGECEEVSSPIPSTSAPQALIVPNVLLVGAQKAGTTAVASWLFKEHNVCHAKPMPDEPQYYSKEVHFFDQHKRYQRGAEFYASHFNHCTSAKLTMDATPGYEINPFRVRDFYMNNHSSASALASTSVSFDDLKLMMILREPISRELSWYNHQKALYIQNNQTSNGKQYWSHIGNPATNGSAYTFDEYVDQYLLPRQARISASKSYVCEEEENRCKSFFSKHLRQWFDWIPRHQMLILSYAELKNDPATFMTRVEDFLGIVRTPKEDSMKEANAKESPAKTDLPSCSSQKKLQAIFEPWNEDLYSLLEQNPGPSMEQRPFSRFQLGECHYF